MTVEEGKTRARKQISIAREQMWLTPHGAGEISADGPVLHLSVMVMTLLCVFVTHGTGCYNRDIILPIHYTLLKEKESGIP